MVKEMQPDERTLLIDIHARVKSIEDRFQAIPDLERRLRELEVLRTLSEKSGDHEQRLRALEHTKQYFLGLAAAIAVVVSSGISFLKDKLNIPP